MLYFAYGSNLDPVQMRLRCPDGRYVGKARLDGHCLCFPRWSKIRGSAEVGLAAADEMVWGVLYELSDADLARLDVREGYNRRRQPTDNIRNRRTVKVTRSDGRVATAEVYVATPSADPGRPTPEYLAYLLYLAVACDLPADYRARLAAIKSVAAAA